MAIQSVTVPFAAFSLPPGFPVEANAPTQPLSVELRNGAQRRAEAIMPRLSQHQAAQVQANLQMLDALTRDSDIHITREMAEDLRVVSATTHPGPLPAPGTVPWSSHDLAISLIPPPINGSGEDMRTIASAINEHLMRMDAGHQPTVIVGQITINYDDTTGNMTGVAGFHGASDQPLPAGAPIFTAPSASEPIITATPGSVDPTFNSAHPDLPRPQILEMDNGFLAADWRNVNDKLEQFAQEEAARAAQGYAPELPDQDTRALFERLTTAVPPGWRPAYVVIPEHYEPQALLNTPPNTTVDLSQAYAFPTFDEAVAFARTQNPQAGEGSDLPGAYVSVMFGSPEGIEAMWAPDGNRQVPVDQFAGAVRVLPNGPMPFPAVRPDSAFWTATASMQAPPAAVPPQAEAGPAPTHTGPVPTHTGPVPTHTGPVPTHADPAPTHADPAPTHTGPAPTEVRLTQPREPDPLPPSATLRSGPVDPGPETSVVVIHDRVAATELLPTDQQGRPSIYLRELAARTPPGEQVVIMTGGVIDSPEARHGLIAATTHSGFGVAELQSHGDMATLTLQRLTPDQEQQLAESEAGIRYGLSTFPRTPEGYYGPAPFSVDSLRGMPEGPGGSPFEAIAGFAAMAAVAEPGSWFGMQTGLEVMQHQDEIREAFRLFGFTEVRFQEQQDGSVNVWVPRPDITTGQMLAADDPSAAQAPGAAPAAAAADLTGPATGPIRAPQSERPAAQPAPRLDRTEAQPAAPVRTSTVGTGTVESNTVGAGTVAQHARLEQLARPSDWLANLARATPAGTAVTIQTDAGAGQYWDQIEATLQQAGFVNIQGQAPDNPFQPFVITAERVAPPAQQPVQPAGNPSTASRVAAAPANATPEPVRANYGHLLPNSGSSFLTDLAARFQPGQQGVIQTGLEALGQANEITAALNAAGFNVLSGGQQDGQVFINVQRMTTGAPAGLAAQAAAPARPAVPPVMTPPAQPAGPPQPVALDAIPMAHMTDPGSPLFTYLTNQRQGLPVQLQTEPLAGGSDQWAQIQTALARNGYTNVAWRQPQGPNGPLVVTADPARR
jgi:hypothetical protein